MTVSSQVKQTLASLKSAQASFETFAIETQDKGAKQIYSNAAQQAQGLINTLEGQVQRIEQEEPEYKGF